MGNKFTNELQNTTNASSSKFTNELQNTTNASSSRVDITGTGDYLDHEDLLLKYHNDNDHTNSWKYTPRSEYRLKSEYKKKDKYPNKRRVEYDLTTSGLLKDHVYEWYDTDSERMVSGTYVEKDIEKHCQFKHVHFSNDPKCEIMYNFTTKRKHSGRLIPDHYFSLYVEDDKAPMFKLISDTPLQCTPFEIPVYYSTDDDDSYIYGGARSKRSRTKTNIKNNRRKAKSVRKCKAKKRRFCGTRRK